MPVLRDSSSATSPWEAPAASRATWRANEVSSRWRSTCSRPRTHRVRRCNRLTAGRKIRRGRSEEHTSELQSRLHLVCRLLLEKKKEKAKNVHRLRHLSS